MASVDLARAKYARTLVLHLLLPVREPSCGAGDGEEDREHVGREAHCLVDEARVEVHVGEELARGKVLVRQRLSLQLRRHFHELVAAQQLEHLLAEFADDLGARVVGLVEAVTEAHEAAAFRLDVLEELRHIVGTADLGQHPQHRLVGTAVPRAVEGPCSTRDGGVGVHQRRAHLPHGGGGAVQLVVGVEDEELVEHAGEHRVGRVVHLRERVEHVEEVLRVGEAVLGAVVRPANAMAVGAGCNGGHLAEDAEDLLVADLLILEERRMLQRRVRLRVERRECRGARNEHSHGVCVIAE
mmetsp:Transcript_1482/g.5242  ORF Transcript_1482/g.5242 Transcript_1482/m.5242 type:complete len:298 (-) Transcript_1482:394-1287(-)